jgi:hypothetical protein
LGAKKTQNAGKRVPGHYALIYSPVFAIWPDTGRDSEALPKKRKIIEKS